MELINTALHQSQREHWGIRLSLLHCGLAIHDVVTCIGKLHGSLTTL